MSIAASTSMQRMEQLDAFFKSTTEGQQLSCESMQLLLRSEISDEAQEQIINDIRSFGANQARQLAEGRGLLPRTVTVATMPSSSRAKEENEKERKISASASFGTIDKAAPVEKGCPTAEAASLDDFLVTNFSANLVRIVAQYIADSKFPGTDEEVYRHLLINIFRGDENLNRLVVIPDEILPGGFQKVLNEIQASIYSVLDSFEEPKTRDMIRHAIQFEGMAPLALHQIAQIARPIIEEANLNLIKCFSCVSKALPFFKKYFDSISSLPSEDQSILIRKWLHQNRESVQKILQDPTKVLSFFLDHIGLTSFPLEIMLFEPKAMNLSGNEMRCLPPCFCQMPLQHLQLCGGYLQSLPENIGDLQDLRTLDLSHARGISFLPESFGHLQKLEALDLSETAIRDFTPLASLVNLRELTLNDMQGINTIPESVLKLPKLSSLTIEKRLYDASPRIVAALKEKGCEVVS